MLDELDAAAEREATFFPDLGHPYNYHVDARLAAYADASRWAIVIERFAVNPRAWMAGMHTTLYYHGTGVTLPPQPGWGEQRVRSLVLWDDGPSAPLLLPDSNEEVNLDAADLRIRGEVVPIRTDAAFYADRGIEIEPLTDAFVDGYVDGIRKAHPPAVADAHADHAEAALRPRVGAFELSTWELARGLVPEHRGLLLATEAERREGVASEFRRLLLLDDWDHPRLMEGERPSDCASFRMIAEVLASSDPSIYDAGKVTANTHWRNWPESGSL